MDKQALLETLSLLCSQSRESGCVEFKSSWEAPKDIGQYIAALANTATLEHNNRAWMVWGVDNSTHAVVGTTFDPFKAKGEGNQSLIMWLSQKIRPKPDFQFYDLTVTEGRVVILEIHPARSAPLAFDGVRYIRIDSHKVSLADHPDKEARLWAMLGDKEDWSGELVPGAGLDDLDPLAIISARNRFTEYLLKSENDVIRHEQIRKDVQSWDVFTLLNKARMTKQGRVTRSALLLLGKDESAHFLSPVDSKMTWILRDANNSTGPSHHFGIPFLLSTDKVLGRIRNEMAEHMPDGTLFPTPVSWYDTWVIREALHNCVAHQDYRLGGKINVVEHPDRLVFSNLGQFIPPSVEWMLEHQSPPEHYRNQWLIDGMIRLRMIEQVGSGIKRMFETQRARFFPLPDFTFDLTEHDHPRVEVTITRKVLDANYTLMLMKRSDLALRQVILLDRVQKKRSLSPAEVRELKMLKLIEGRSPKYFISAKVAEWTGQKARYIHNRGFDDDYYRKLLVDYLNQYGRATRREVDELLLSKMPDVLDADQKAHKVRNLLQAMRREELIHREGPKATAYWLLCTDEHKFIAKS